VTSRSTFWAAPAVWRWQVASVKNAVALAREVLEVLMVSMMTSTLASAAYRPTPLSRSTPVERLKTVTSCPARPAASTT
jgi:hypothetical protein